MKVVPSSLVVAATIKSSVDAFQVPLGSKITASTHRAKTVSSLRITSILSLSPPRRSLPFLSQIRSTSKEDETFELNDDNYDSDNDAKGRSIVDQLTLEEQKELILQQLSMVDDDEDDSEDQDRGEDVRSNDDDYYNYYDDNNSNQRMDQSYYDSGDSYYGYDDISEDLPPRERRRRRRQREAASSFGATASELAEAAIRIGGKATNVAKKTTERAWQSLVDNTFEDEWEDDDEYQSQSLQQRRQSSSRPSRSTSRPVSRYERERMGETRRRPQKEIRQHVDDFAAYRSLDDDNKDYVQTERCRIRREPRKQPQRKPIEETTDSLESNGASRQPPPESKSEEVLGEEDVNNNLDKTNANGASANGENPSWKSILEKTSKVATKKAKAIPRKIVDKAERTAQKAKEMSYKAVSSLLEDDEEDTKVDPVVMDAVIEDKIEERVVVAEPIPMEEWPSNAWSQSQQPPTSSPEPTMRDTTFESPPPPSPRQRRQPSSSSSAPPRRRRPRPSRPPQTSGNAMDERITSGTDWPTCRQEEQKYYYGLFQLPPAEGTFQEPTMDQESTARAESRGRNARRKVYSPYNNNRGSDDYEYKNEMYTDGVDRMGNFVAEALDTFLWGREDGEGRPNRRRNRRQNPSVDNGDTPKRHKRSGHWKDRMEEQFDEFLGIHEGGKYYDRWANQDSEMEDLEERNRKKNGTSRDPMSFARGEVRRGKHRGRSRPIWEEEDSLLSVLFGTDSDTVRRNARMYRSNSNLPFPGSGGSLLRVAQSMLGSLALVAGRISQWASVRGSVPQPVIVVVLMSALLSARPGRRWQTILFATLALRMVGELLHGYMYDDLDFEDDLSVVSHREGRKGELDDDDGFGTGRYDGADYM